MVTSNKRTEKSPLKSLQNVLKNPVFAISAAITVVMALWGIIGSSSFAAVADGSMSFLKNNFAWLFLYGMTFFVVFCVVIAISKFGKKRLGGDDERPSRSTISWFGMLFASGMGIGMVFWGIAEPISHYVSPMAGIEPMTEEALRFSVRSTIMHWGLHPWACYAVVGMALAFFIYRKKKLALISSTLFPIFGSSSRKWLGKAVDIYVVVLTSVGIATSFGMGCLQLSGGLNYVFGVPSNWISWLTIIGVICLVYIWSSISGVDKGMRRLTNINLALCVVLMIIAFVVGPQIEIINNFLLGIGDYLANFIQDSVRLSSQGDATWILDWRVFYWAWWISWAPFVGLFIARISRGRTIRQFVVGAMISPTLFSAIWFTLFGTFGIEGGSSMTADQLAAIAAVPETASFIIYSQYPLSMVMTWVAMVLIVIFFITSADSATFVMAMLTSSGSLNPPKAKKLFWGVLIAAMAFALIISGGVSMLQTLAVVMAFPFFFIMLIMCVSLVKSLILEGKDEKEGLKAEVTGGDTAGGTA